MGNTILIPFSDRPAAKNTGNTIKNERFLCRESLKVYARPFEKLVQTFAEIIGAKMPNLRFFCTFLQKSLHISKKSSTFAAGFEKRNFFPMRLGEASRRGEEEQRSDLFAQQIC